MGIKNRKDKVTNVEVIFNKLPKNGRKYFTKGLLLKKAVDIATADQDIKEYAHNMQPNTSSKISFEVSTEEESFVFDTVIEPEDTDLGIVGLIRRDSDDEELDSEESIQIEDLISSIQDELIDATDNDNNDELSNRHVNHATTESDTMEDSTNTAPKTQTEQNPNVNKTNKSANTENISKEPKAAEIKVAKIAPLPMPSSESAKKEINELELTPYDQYTNPNDIYARVPVNYGVNEFAVENIKFDLGYKKEPANKYEIELNGFINSCLQDYGVKKIQSDYDEQLAKLKAQILEKLIKKYNEITPANLIDEVTEKIASKIAELKQTAELQKKDLKTAVLNQEKAEQFKQEKADEIKVVEYKQKLATERAIALKAFNEKVEAESKQKSLSIDDELKNKQQEEKRKSLHKLVKQYNEALQNSRSDIGHEFDLAVRSNYDKHNQAFTLGLQEILPAVKDKKVELQKQETADIADARKRQAEMIKQRQKDEELRLKKRELDQRQHYNELNEQALQKLPEAIKEALAGQLKPINVSVNQTENQSDTTEPRELVPIIPGHLVDDSNKNEDQAHNNKNKHKKMLIAVITGIGIATAVGATWYLNKPLDVKNSPSATPKTEVMHHAIKSKIKKSVSTKKSIKTKEKKKVSDLEKYSKYDSWATRRDFLNGLLGQKDVRSLAQIATKYPSKLASLYYVIANEDQYRIRATWLSMTVQEKQEASTAAKQAVALAFYNVHDWQNGWLARYAY